MCKHQTIQYDKNLPTRIRLRDGPVNEALKNGFGHYNHFTKACRKYYGASPTEIKRQKRQRDAAPNAPLVKSA